MSILSILKALRIGSSLQNPTPFKWFGLASALSIIALQVAQHYGLMTGVTTDDWLQLVMLVLVLLSQIITTDKIGVLPPAREPLPKLRDHALPTGADEPSSFPSGPFFDNDR